MHLFCILFFLWQALGDLPPQDLLSTLAQYSQLSDLVIQIHSFPKLLQEFDNAHNFTFIAPSNNALSVWRSTHHSQDLLEMTLTYHFLQGIYPSAPMINSPKIIPTALTNATFTNVTGGQRVKAFYNEHVILESGVEKFSNVIMPDIPAYGGLIHVVDTVLEVPPNIAEAIPQANLTYLIQIISKGNYLNASNRDFYTKLAIEPDQTILLSNSAAALAHTNSTGWTEAEIARQIEYHQFDRLVYSTDLSNGTELMTRAGIPVLITVDRDGSVYVNAAKITVFDVLIANGVFHVIDDILDPNNITRPLLASNQSIANTTRAISTPSNTFIPAPSLPSDLSTNAAIGIGVGAAIGLIALIATAILFYRWRRTPDYDTEFGTEFGEAKNNFSELSGSVLCEASQQEIELSSYSLYEVAQLETKEKAVELPGEYYYSIGRAL